MARSWCVRALLMALGMGSLALGLIGVFVPLLPTTPFLLLAAACFLRSSERLYAWLIHHPWLGSYIRNYREHRAMTLRAKVVALSLLWVVIGHSVLLATDKLWLRGLLLVVAACVTTHIVLLRTMKLTKSELGGGQINAGLRP